MISTFPTLTTPRLLLREITEADLENIFKGLSHPEVITYYGVSYKTLEETQIQLDWFDNLLATGTGIWWAVCSLEDGEFYGAGGFNNWDKTHKKAEVGFWLLPAFWGKGYMSEAMPRICQYAFDQMEIHRIEGFVESENVNCKKAMERLNFVHEGTMRDCEVKEGAFISVDIFAKLV